LSLTSRIINLRNNADEIKKNSEFSLKSSTTLSDKTKASLKTNSLSVDNIKNFDESISMSMTRRPSQITAIPENEIADSFCSNSDQDIHESMNFHRMRSVDNIMPSYNRTRMSSIPNKMYIGMTNMRSYDNFQNSNDNFVRKGSTRSVSNSNINPNINPNTNTNTSVPSRKCSSNPSENSLSNINEEKSTSSQNENEIIIITQNIPNTSTFNGGNN